MAAVEHDAGADLRVAASGKQRQTPAHAKSDRADFTAGDSGLTLEMSDRRVEIARGFVDSEAHHQLARLVRRFRGLAVIQIRRQRHESFLGESIGNVLDVWNQPPPLLNDDD